MKITQKVSFYNIASEASFYGYLWVMARHGTTLRGTEPGRQSKWDTLDDFQTLIYPTPIP